MMDEKVEEVARRWQWGETLRWYPEKDDKGKHLECRRHI